MPTSTSEPVGSGPCGSGGRGEAIHAALLSWTAGEELRWQPDAKLTLDSGGRIAAIESDSRARPPTRLAVPGLIDVHTHLPQYPMVARDGLKLLEWLERYIFPCERAFSAERASQLAPLFFAELLRRGTTAAAVYTSIDPASCEASFRAAEASGMRVVMGKMMMDRRSYGDLPQREILAASLDQSRELCARWHGAAGGRLAYAYTPRFALSCSRELMAEVGRLARESGAYVQTHLAETPEEVEAVRADFPEALDYTDVYERAGLLGPRSIFGHAIHLSDREVERLGATSSAIAHCPSANLFLGAGVLPLDQRRAAGVRIGLGTDVAAGPELSLWEVMKAGLYAQKARAALGGGRAATAAEYFRIATLGGVEALGIDDRVGSLEVGKEADLSLIDLDLLRLPGEEPGVWWELDGPAVIARLIYRSHPDMVRETRVAGRTVWRRQSGQTRLPSARSNLVT
ncbi:MAG TPA: guanine deaminase [Acidobacteriota bacterium]